MSKVIIILFTVKLATQQTLNIAVNAKYCSKEKNRQSTPRLGLFIKFTRLRAIMQQM